MLWVCSEKFFVCFAHLKQDSSYGHLLALCVECVVVACVSSMLAHDPYLIRILISFVDSAMGKWCTGIGLGTRY